MSIQISNKELFRSQSFIEGKWIASDQTFKVFNPSTQKLISEVADHGLQECEIAIKAARLAFDSWKNLTASKRSRILKNWYRLIMSNAKDLATILSMEQGKPFVEALGEVKYGASYVEWFAEEARRVYGDVIPGHGQDKRIMIIMQPIGVVGAITPWNFPSAMITRKVAPALAAGCTVVLKPSELTPLSALALAELSEKAEFPPGVFNVVTSSQPAPIGKLLCESPLVRKISFTGSTRVGKILLQQCAEGVKKVSLELGGNAPFIVFDDAKVEAAIEGTLSSKFRNNGQTCICANRIFVHSKVYDEFSAGLSKKILELKVGDGFAEDSSVGPLINQSALEKVTSLLEDASGKGGKVLCGGKKTGGLFFEPTLITNLNSEMDIFHSEIFGPVAAIYKFETEAEVIALANKTNYGLASYFYGQDYARIWRVAEALEYGMVGINTTEISTAVAPFGGVKESGMGREGAAYGMAEYLNVKYLCWGNIKNQSPD